MHALGLATEANEGNEGQWTFPSVSNATADSPSIRITMTIKSRRSGVSMVHGPNSRPFYCRSHHSMNPTSNKKLGRAPTGQSNASPGPSPRELPSPNKKALKGRATVESWTSITVALRPNPTTVTSPSLRFLCWLLCKVPVPTPSHVPVDEQPRREKPQKETKETKTTRKVHPIGVSL